jgi:simple sugar transport system permease protein
MRRAALLSSGRSLLLSLAAVLLALVSAALLLWAAGADPLRALGDMWAAAFGSGFSLSSTVTKALPRLLTGIAVAIALRAGLWNIGAEGQLYLGAIGATAVALFVPSLPGPMTPLLALGAGLLAGAAWALLPGLLRARRGVSEVITSLMLVYVAIQLASYLATGPWGVPGGTFPGSQPIPAGARLPVLVDGTVLNAGVLVAVVAAVVAWLITDRSTLGVRLRAVGGNPTAASALGLDVAKLLLLAMCLSGALAGLGGAVEVLGTRGRLIDGFSPGYGFEGIAVALLGRLRPLGIVAAALLFGALDAGGAGLQTAGSGLSSSIVQVTAALSVTYLLAALGLQDLRKRRRAARQALAAGATAPVPDAAESVAR